MAATGVGGGRSKPGLWRAIEAAELPGFSVPKRWYKKARVDSFRDRLFLANNLTKVSAQRLEAEYRRYLYLKALDGGRLTPSTWVDRAWHLHMEAPDGAWERFCDEVLGARVTHETGLARAGAKASYARTRALYRTEFAEEPPSDIWPEESEERLRAFERRCVSLAGILFSIGVLGILLLGALKEPGLLGPMVMNLVPFNIAAAISGSAILVGILLFVLGICASSVKRRDLETNCG